MYKSVTGTYFFSGPQQRFKNFRRWSKKNPIKDSDVVVAPINENSHYSMVLILNPMASGDNYMKRQKELGKLFLPIVKWATFKNACSLLVVSSNFKITSLNLNFKQYILELIMKLPENANHAFESEKSA